MKSISKMRAAGTQVYGNLNVRDAAQHGPGLQSLAATYSSNRFPYRPVPRGMPYIWLGAFIIFFTLAPIFVFPLDDSRSILKIRSKLMTALAVG